MFFLSFSAKERREKKKNLPLNDDDDDVVGYFDVLRVFFPSPPLTW